MVEKQEKEAPYLVSYPVQVSRGRWERSCPCPPDQRTPQNLGPAAPAPKEESPRPSLAFMWLWQPGLAASSSVCKGSLMLGLICTGHGEGRERAEDGWAVSTTAGLPQLKIMQGYLQELMLLLLPPAPESPVPPHQPWPPVSSRPFLCMGRWFGQEPGASWCSP